MSLRMYDYRCGVCGDEIHDELVDSTDPAPVCCGFHMNRVISAPLVDAPGEFYDVQSGRTVSSLRSLDTDKRYTTLSTREFRDLKWDAQKRAEKKRNSQISEAVARGIYRTKHGYKDYPDLPKERN